MRTELSQRARYWARHAAISALAGREQLASRLQHSSAESDGFQVRNFYFHSLRDGDVKKFRSLVESIHAEAPFVSYTTGVRATLAGSIDRPMSTLSVDDGFGSNLLVGRFLEELGISACFFVSPPLLDVVETSEIYRFFRTKVDVEPTVVSWDGVLELIDRGHEIGSHGWSHRNLAELDGEDLEVELRGSREALAARCGQVLHFAWPFGRFHHFNRTAHDAALSAGYESVASAERGVHGPSLKARTSADMVIHREHIDPTWPLHQLRYFAFRRQEPVNGNWPWTAST